MRLWIASAATACLVMTIGCAKPSAETEGEVAPAAESAAASGPPPSAEELAAATYLGIEDQASATLVDGKWEGEPFEEGGASLPTIWLTDDFYLAGDLDGDGAEEAVAHVSYNSGGTGHFGYLAVMGREGGAVVQEGLASVGDRVRIHDARIEDGGIVLEVLQVGPDDGMCCPSQLAKRTFTMQGDELVETATEVIGTVSPATLEGREWVLSKFSSTETAPAEPEVTLRIEGDRVSGSSGCNNYNGTLEQGEIPTGLSVGPLMTTRKACPPEIMDLEQRYTTALQGAQSWDLLFGQLIINYQQGDEFGSLFFEGREPTTGP